MSLKVPYTVSSCDTFVKNQFLQQIHINLLRFLNLNVNEVFIEVRQEISFYSVI